MRILVTGGSGFIGSNLVKELSKAGFEIFLLSRRDAKESLDQHVKVIKCDLLDDAFDFEKILDGCSVVFNCVGELHDEHLMQKLHVDATRRLVMACKVAAKKTNNPIHFVQLSSVGAYGPSAGRSSDSRVVTEETMTSPVGTYEITKTEADKLIVSAAETGVFSFCILRPSNVYGASMPNNSIRQWGKLVEKKMFFYIGEPGAIATYVHVDDVVEALILCGFDKNAKNQIFNISNDCVQEDIVRAFAEKFRVKEPKIRLPERLIRLGVNVFSGFKKFPLSHSRVDALVSRTSYPADKLSRVLGFEPKWAVKETIGEVFEEKSE